MLDGFDRLICFSAIQTLSWVVSINLGMARIKAVSVNEKQVCKPLCVLIFLLKEFFAVLLSPAMDGFDQPFIHCSLFLSYAELSLNLSDFR